MEKRSPVVSCYLLVSLATTLVCVECSKVAPLQNTSQRNSSKLVWSSVKPTEAYLSPCLMRNEPCSASAKHCGWGPTRCLSLLCRGESWRAGNSTFLSSGFICVENWVQMYGRVGQSRLHAASTKSGSTSASKKAASRSPSKSSKVAGGGVDRSSEGKGLTNGRKSIKTEGGQSEAKAKPAGRVTHADKTVRAGKAEGEAAAAQKKSSGFSTFLKRQKKKALEAGVSVGSRREERPSFMQAQFPELLRPVPKTLSLEEDKTDAAQQKNLFGPQGLGVLSDLLYSEIEAAGAAPTGEVAELDLRPGDEGSGAKRQEEEQELGEHREAEAGQFEVPSLSEKDQEILRIQEEEELARVSREVVEKEPLGVPATSVAADVLSGDRLPRLTVTLTEEHTFATLMDDFYRQVICSASTKNSIGLRQLLPWTQSLTSRHARLQGETVKAGWEVGKLVGRMTRSKGINAVRFDRVDYRYAGRVAAVARGAAAVGLSVFLDTRSTVRTCRKRGWKRRLRKPEVFDPQNFWVPAIKTAQQSDSQS